MNLVRFLPLQLLLALLISSTALSAEVRDQSRHRQKARPTPTPTTPSVTVETPIGFEPSRYTERLIQTVKQAIAEPAPAPESGPESRKLRFRCLETEGAPFYMGFYQTLWIDSPLERVAAVLDHVDGYAQLFPGYEEVKLVSREGPFWKTAWEQIVPVPFVPNVRFEMDYLALSPRKEVRLYRYQLGAKGKIKASDGAILLRSVGERTYYREWDFYDAHWGIAESFGRKRLWQENLEGIALSNLAIQAKAEKPSLTDREARDAAKRAVQEQDLDLECKQWSPATEALR